MKKRTNKEEKKKVPRAEAMLSEVDFGILEEGTELKVMEEEVASSEEWSSFCSKELSEISSSSEGRDGILIAFPLVRIFLSGTGNIAIILAQFSAPILSFILEPTSLNLYGIPIYPNIPTPVT